MMKYFQKIGKSLMLPVAVLPAAGILYGIGYWIDPTGWGSNSVIAAFLIKAASAIIDQIPILWEWPKIMMEPVLLRDLYLSL